MRRRLRLFDLPRWYRVMRQTATNLAIAGDLGLTANDVQGVSPQLRRSLGLQEWWRRPHVSQRCWMPPSKWRLPRWPRSRTPKRSKTPQRKKTRQTSKTPQRTRTPQTSKTSLRGEAVLQLKGGITT
jgi:hypothetical protein